jgi:hypothetical protein
MGSRLYLKTLFECASEPLLAFFYLSETSTTEVRGWSMDSREWPNGLISESHLLSQFGNSGTDQIKERFEFIHSSGAISS